MKNLEHKIQAAYFKWCSYNAHRHPAIGYIHAIPNGGHRHPATAMKLKAEGVKRGIPDVFIPYPTTIFHGAYIEFKAGKNKLTPEQEQYQAWCEENDYSFITCYDFLTAMVFTMEYLGLKV